MTDKKSSPGNKESKKDNAPDEKHPITEARKIAEEDIEADPDLSTKPEPGDDLDEGELARLEGED